MEIHHSSGTKMLCGPAMGSNTYLYLKYSEVKIVFVFDHYVFVFGHYSIQIEYAFCMTLQAQKSLTLVGFSCRLHLSR